MSKHTHTPGPWQVSDTSIVTESICIAVIEDDGECAAESSQRKANACLIAASPDLLACCKLWLSYFDRLTRDDDPGDPLAAERKRVHGSRVEATRAAIAKAQGTDAAQAAKE